MQDGTDIDPEAYETLWEHDFVRVPDAVDLVVEAANLMAVFAADRAVRIDAMRRAALAEAAAHGRVLMAVAERSIRLELASALRITESAAGDLLVFSESLVQRHTGALAALARAGITERHAQILVAELDAASAETRALLGARALELAESEPVGTFRRKLRGLIAAAEATTLSERHGVALERRRIAVEKAEDGMAWLHAYVPDVEAQAILARATAMAKVLAARDGETRTLDQLRADILCDLLIEGDSSAHPAEARGIRATVVVTVPVLSLLDDAVATANPAVVEGIGPIPIERARELSGGADGWMRVLTHPETGAVLSVGREQYRPPPSLRRLIRWRADRCMAPGCGMPASRCEIDHTIAWQDGGTTALGNLHPLCKGHHTIKHHGGWRVVHRDDGALEWTSPGGRQYVVRPERTVPEFRPTAVGGPPPF
jgi:hypothetical protein